MKKNTNRIINWAGAIGLVVTSYCAVDIAIQYNRANAWKSNETLTEYLQIDLKLQNYGIYNDQQIKDHRLSGTIDDLVTRRDLLKQKSDFNPTYSGYQNSMKDMGRGFGIGSISSLLAYFCWCIKDLKKREAEGR